MRKSQAEAGVGRPKVVSNYSTVTDCFRRVVIMLTLVTHCIELDPAVLIYLVLYFLRQQLGCRPSVSSEFVFGLWIVRDNIKFKPVAEGREVFLHIVKIDNEIDNRFFTV